MTCSAGSAVADAGAGACADNDDAPSAADANVAAACAAGLVDSLLPSIMPSTIAARPLPAIVHDRSCPIGLLGMQVGLAERAKLRSRDNPNLEPFVWVDSSAPSPVVTRASPVSTRVAGYIPVESARTGTDWIPMCRAAFASKVVGNLDQVPRAEPGPYRQDIGLGRWQLSKVKERALEMRDWWWMSCENGSVSTWLLRQGVVTQEARLSVRPWDYSFPVGRSGRC